MTKFCTNTPMWLRPQHSRDPVCNMSTNLPTENTDEKGALLMHKDAIVFAEQLGVRVQTQYKQEYLADLMTAYTLYGVETYRAEAGVKLFGTV